MPHNHSPKCCCGHAPQTSNYWCPSCVEHGELATLSNSPECPSCHAHDGQPHTDYCPTLRDHTHRWGQVMNGQVNFPPVCVNCLARYDLPDAKLPCPRYDAPITSQPPTTTTTPTNTHPR